MAGDPTSEENELVWATAMAPDADLFNQKVEGVAWRTKPSVHRGQAGPHGEPELERFAAERMGATRYEVENSDVPMLPA